MSRGAVLKRVSVSGDCVVAIDVASEKAQPRQRESIDKLDYTSRFVHVIPKLSQHCRKTQ